jgi:DNA repair protein RadC
MNNQIKNEEAAIYGQEQSGSHWKGSYDKDKFEDAVIKNAIRIIESRLKTFGASLTNAKLVTDLLKIKLANLEHEEFHVLYLNNQHQLIEIEMMFRGTVDAASVYPREVAKRALQLNAAAVIFAHNHPSQLAEASLADDAITQKLKNALKLLDIRTLDHIVIAGNNYVSYAESGKI